LSTFLVRQEVWFSLFGGVFLCGLGVRIFRERPASEAASANGTGVLGAFGSSLVITLTNPATILSFIGIFAGLGLGVTPNGFAAMLLVAGVFFGSALWWAILSTAAGRFRSRTNAASLGLINRCSGSFLVALGLYALIGLTLRRWP
jgi:threonine/homoserine/homoserine lactone efflux protein